MMKAKRGLTRTEKFLLGIVATVAVLSAGTWAWALHDGAEFARCVDEQKAAGLQPNC
jgi:hypothetical protein